MMKNEYINPNIVGSSINSTENNEKGDKNMENLSENVKNVEENVIDTTVTEKVKEVRAKLRKKNGKASKSAKATKTKTIKKGGDTMGDKRLEAEAILEKVCKELKLTTRRLNPLSTSNSPIGALQADGKCGGLKVRVGVNEIVLFSPQSYLGYGYQHAGIYVHLTKVKWSDANMEKAFRKALKDAKTKEEWSAELGFIPRNQQKKSGRTLAQVTSERERLEARLKALKAEEKKRKTATSKLRKGKKAKAITKVAEQTA